MANILLSVLLNTRHSWESEEMKIVLKGNEDIMRGLVESLVLDMAEQFVPFVRFKILKRAFPSKVTRITTAKKGMCEFIAKHVMQHRATFDANNMRDFLDYYLRDRKEEGFTDKKFTDTAAIFFTDGVSTAAELVLWAILYLRHYPKVQAEAQRQIDEVII